MFTLRTRRVADPYLARFDLKGMAMLAFCMRCWSQMSSGQATCPECGAQVDDDPRSFEEKMVAALEHPLPETHVRICWLLGRTGRWAVPHLICMLLDEDVFVPVAALASLGEIGDESAKTALEEAATDPSLLVRIAAKNALRQIGTRKSA